MIRTDMMMQVVADWRRDGIPSNLARRQLARNVDVRKLTNVLAVVGPRRAGKTFFLFQLIGDLLSSGVPRDKILFVDFEDYRLKGMQAEDLDGLLAAWERLTGLAPQYLFFDEIQVLPEWSRALRTLHNRRRFTIVVTGSNSSLLTREVATELRGRYEDVRLQPFSFRELLDFRQVSWDASTLYTPERGRLVRVFEEYLESGGFPDVCRHETVSERRGLLRNYYDTVYYRDMLDRHGIKARAIMDRLMAAVLEGAATTFSISAFEKQLKAAGLAGSKRTLSNYLEFLREAFFLLAAEKYSPSLRKRMMNPYKVYLIDTGFGLLTGGFPANRGRWLENAVAVEWARREQEFFYFQGTRECDFILANQGRPTEAWQVCWEMTPENEKRELGGLAEAMAKTGVSAGGILTFDQVGERRLPGGREVKLIPLWRWMLET